MDQVGQAIAVLALAVLSASTSASSTSDVRIVVAARQPTIRRE